MGYTNIPPTMSELFWELDKRIGRLETAYRFNAPNVNLTTNLPTNARAGDIYFNLDGIHLAYYNGVAWKRINDSNL